MGLLGIACRFFKIGAIGARGIFAPRPMPHVHHHGPRPMFHRPRPLAARLWGRPW